MTTPTPDMPDEIYAKNNPEIWPNKVWYGTRGMGVKYVRADLAAPSQWLSVDKITVDAQRGLDQISVYFENFEKGAGKVIIHCYDMAWTAYWGAMGDKSIQQFFMGCDAGYLTDRLTSGQFYSRAKYHDDYMTRIVTAIHTHMKNLPQPPTLKEKI